METGQISQSLRASMIQQSQQGMTVAQMMSSGISFADIIAIMIGNTNSSASDGLFANQLLQTEGQPAADSIIPEQFSDIFSLISPEILSQKNLYSSLFSDGEFENSSEIMDFSESVIKADPSQLAGLMDFIRTGNELPLFTQINDSSATSVSSAVGDIKALFDPGEMLKSGEMEIVSYIPASQQAVGESAETTDMSDDAILSFYRTMNTVKDNTEKPQMNPSASDETNVGNENDASDSKTYNVENLSKFANPIDISFERAEAEMTMNKAEYEPVEKQVLKGVSENIEQGKSEFTVKLKPEGLGEILVKLVSDNDGKMLLTMLASSEKTAELLNRDLAALQSTLSQYNVKIANNSVDAAENVMPAASAFNEYDQRRQDEGNQQNQYRQIKSKLKNNIQVSGVSFDSEANLQTNSVPDRVLDIMI